MSDTCFHKIHIPRYPRYFFLFLNAAAIIIHIVCTVEISQSYGYNEWQLYGFISPRSCNLLFNLLFSPMVIGLGIVSFPKYFKLWQIFFTIILVIPLVLSIFIAAYCNSSSISSLVKQMDKTYSVHYQWGIDVQPFISTELLCTVNTSADGTGCCDKAIVEYQSKSQKQIKSLTLAITITDCINFVINLLFLIIFEAPESSKIFGSSDEGN